MYGVKTPPDIDPQPTYVVDRRVGRLVAGYVAAGGHTRQALAEFIPLDKGSLSRSINGERQWNLSELFRIAEFLDVPVSYLIDPDGQTGARMLEVRASRCTVSSLRPEYEPALDLLAA